MGNMDPPAKRAAAPSGGSGGAPLALVVGAWVVVGLPLLWGVLQTLEKAAALFR